MVSAFEENTWNDKYAVVPIIVTKLNTSNLDSELCAVIDRP